MNQEPFKTLFDYLYLKSDTIIPAEYIVGFGHFDMKISERCARLYLEKYAPQIIFTGRFGAGSADLKKPEAQTFASHVKEKFDDFPASVILIEDQSTNTSENIDFVNDRFFIHHPDITRVIIVANAYRQRRVYLTCIKHLPDITFINAPPDTTYVKEIQLFKDKGENLNRLLIGEIDRLLLYSQKGYMADPEIPKDIYQIYKTVKNKSKNHQRV